MEPLIVACLACLFVLTAIATAAVAMLYEVGQRFIEWTRRWEKMWNDNDAAPSRTDDDFFPGDEWKHGKKEDDE